MAKSHGRRIYKRDSKGRFARTEGRFDPTRRAQGQGRKQVAGVFAPHRFTGRRAITGSAGGRSGGVIALRPRNTAAVRTSSAVVPLRGSAVVPLKGVSAARGSGQTVLIAGAVAGGVAAGVAIKRARNRRRARRAQG